MSNQELEICMTKPKVLMIQTGGTIGQERGLDGVLRPSPRDYLDRVPGIHDIADITVIRPANIDSTNMLTEQRIDLAQRLFDAHSQYDGFVVVHGTDTMVDTAAALTYMLQEFGKPIILTGSQISIFEPNSDGVDNLKCAVEAATMDIGEVAIAFGSKLVRGVQSLKMSVEEFNTFDSPRVAPIGCIDGMVFLNSHVIPRGHRSPVLFTGVNTGIAHYSQPSGVSASVFGAYVNSDEIHGLIISGFGAGNIQDQLIPYIKNATERGKPVVVVTKCISGEVDMGIYEVGSAALNAGAVAAGDLTLEAATQKMMFALGKADAAHLTGADRLAFVAGIIQQAYGNDVSTPPYTPLDPNRFDVRISRSVSINPGFKEISALEAFYTAGLVDNSDDRRTCPLNHAVTMVCSGKDFACNEKYLLVRDGNALVRIQPDVRAIDERMDLGDFVGYKTRTVCPEVFQLVDERLRLTAKYTEHVQMRSAMAGRHPLLGLLY